MKIYELQNFITFFQYKRVLKFYISTKKITPMDEVNDNLFIL